MKPEQILELADEKLSQRAIAERLGTSKTTVARVQVAALSKGWAL